jgi:hypothetical protein
MKSKRAIVVAASLLICVILFGSACRQNGAGDASHQHQAQKPEPSPTATAMTRRIPAFFKERPAAMDLPMTMPPQQFEGKVRQAYQVAKEIPQTLAQLPCFCYCDTVGHKSLHSCYETDHSAGCTVCVDSALMASQLKKQGLGDEQIREKLIAKYSGF